MYSMVEQKVRPEKPVGEERSLKCGICHKLFNFQSDLKRHSHVHSGFKPHCCSYCSKRFLKSSDLKRHVRTHTGEKPYPCLICSRPFANSYDLTKHTRVHTGEKPYSCPQCGRRFANTSNLRIHQRAHTGEKPYKCTECNKKFSYASGLRDHKKTHLVSDCVAITDADVETVSKTTGGSEKHVKTQTSKITQSLPNDEKKNPGVIRSESQPGQKHSKLAVTLPPRRHSDPIDSREKHGTGGCFHISNGPYFKVDDSRQQQPFGNSVPNLGSKSRPAERQHTEQDIQSPSKLEKILTCHSAPNCLETSPSSDPYKETRAQLNSVKSYLLSDGIFEQAIASQQKHKQPDHPRPVMNSSQANCIDQRSNAVIAYKQLAETSIHTRNEPYHDNGDLHRPSLSKYNVLSQCLRNDQWRYPLKKRATLFQCDTKDPGRQDEPLNVSHMNTEDYFNKPNQVHPINLNSSSYRMGTQQNSMTTPNFDNSQVYGSNDFQHPCGSDKTNYNMYQRGVPTDDDKAHVSRPTQPQSRYTGAVSPSYSYADQKKAEMCHSENSIVYNIPPNSDSLSHITAKSGVLKSAIDDTRYIVPIATEQHRSPRTSNETSVKITNAGYNSDIDLGTAPITPVTCRNSFNTHYAQGPPPLLAFTKQTTDQLAELENNGHDDSKAEYSKNDVHDAPLDLTVSKRSLLSEEQIPYRDQGSNPYSNGVRSSFDSWDSDIEMRNKEYFIGGQYAVHSRHFSPPKKGICVMQMLDHVIRTELQS